MKRYTVQRLGGYAPVTVRGIRAARKLRADREARGERSLVIVDTCRGTIVENVRRFP